jgi:hypothetical protein
MHACKYKDSIELYLEESFWNVCSAFAWLWIGTGDGLL